MHLNKQPLRWLSAAFIYTLVLQTAAADPTMAAGQTAWQDLGRGVALQTATGLGWTRQDNGQDINWADAKAYCAKLGDGWRLPTVEESSQLYAAAEKDGHTAACGHSVCKLPPQFLLSGDWHWSNTPVTREQARDYDELAWGLTMVNGHRTMNIAPVPEGARALCVRS